MGEAFNFVPPRWIVLSWACSAGRRHSRIKVLFPEPLTPVTQTSRSSGKWTVRFFKLFALALRSVSQRKSEIRDPKSEGSPKSEARIFPRGTLAFSDFGFRISFGFRI